MNQPLLSKEMESKTQIGYILAEADQEESRALATAFDLVRRLRRVGAETRVWAIRTNDQARRVLARFRQIPSNATGMQPLMERQFLEIVIWRDALLKATNGFIDKTEESLDGMKRLNPPLTTARLKPFREASQTERHITMNALDMFAKTVEELMALHTAIAQQESRILLYNPAP